MKNSRRLFPYAIIICVALILINNMFYGFSWTDEGLYLSNVHRIFSGDRMLIDDWTPTQFYEPLLLPLYALYVKVNGGTGGIFIFFRITTIFFQFMVSMFSYYVLSKKYNALSSSFASIIPLIFSRACLDGPSYYTIGFETYLLALLCLYAFFSLSKSKTFLFLAGISLAASILCNPFLVVPYIVASICALFFSVSRKYIKEIVVIWIGTTLSGIVYLVFIFVGNSVFDILSGLHFTYNDPSYKHTFILTLKRLYKMPRLLVFPYILTWLPMIVVCIVVKMKKIKLTPKKSIVIHLLNTVFFLANCFISKDCGVAIVTFFHFTLSESILLSRLRIKDFLYKNKAELMYFVIPGFILAYFFCFASDTGFGVCAIGMSVAAIGEILIVEKILTTSDLNFSKFTIKIAKTLPYIILIVFTFFNRINYVYRDRWLSPHLLFLPSFNKGIVKINEGPVKGIYTTEDNKVYYDKLLSFLRDISNSEPTEERSIFIAGVATWAYTAFPNLRCSAPTTWRIFFDDDRLRTFYEEFPKKDFPEYVLLLNPKSPSNEEILEYEDDKLLNSWFYRELERRNYTKQEFECGTLFKNEHSF